MGTPEAQRSEKQGGTGDEPDPAADDSGGEAYYPLPEDELFHVLQNERRRAVLRYLNGTEGTVRMRDVAEQVAAWEHDTTVDQLSSDQRQRVYIALYQSHLDTLDDADIVEYEKSRGNVRLTEVGQDVASYMQGVDEAGDGLGWQDRSLDYVAATAASSVLIGGTTTGYLGFVSLSSFTVSILTVVLFTAVTASRVVAEFA